jgi:Carboxypeptidase regulatory-like domain
MPLAQRQTNAPWGRPFFFGAVFAVLVAVLLHGQVGGAGRIDGTARDAGDSPLPGTRIRVASADLTQTAITSADGRFAFPSLPQGRYTVTAELAGFQTPHQTGVQVTAGQTTIVNFMLRVGCLHEVLYVQGPGFDYVLRDADVIAHLRISAVSATRRFDFQDKCWVGTQYDATPIEVLTGGISAGASSSSIRFVLEGETSYEPGQEYVVFLERDRSNVLHPVMGASSLVPVADGRVEWPRTDVPALTDGMSVEDFLAALISMRPAARPN